MKPTWSKHARERWALRCGHLDPEVEWRSARAISAKRLARLSHSSGSRTMRRCRVRYLLTRSGILFVVAILTVYRVG